MGLSPRRVLTLALTVALVSGTVGPAFATAPALVSDPSPPSASAAPGAAPERQAEHGLPEPLSFHGESDAELAATQEIWLTPDTPGEVRIQFRYAIPDRITALRTAVPDDAQVRSTVGFRQGPDREYHWDGSTNTPAITFSLPVNESVNATGPDAAAGHRVAVDAGEWALFRRPRMPTHWESYGTGDAVRFNRTVKTAGPGATGEWLVYLGEHDTYERDAHDQRFRLIVPGNANMTASPTTVLDSLTDASDALRVGDRDEEVFVVAAPTDEVPWGVRGLQTGDADMWVRDVEPVANASNPWLHEYVHSRQDLTLTPEMRWFREASASYYAALLTFEQHRVDYDAFRDRVAAGATGSAADAVLTNRSTWTGRPNYDRGALVLGQIDRRIRNAQDRERTLQTVFRAMNGEFDATSLSAFLAHLDEHGDTAVLDAGLTYADTDADVPTWNRTAHLAAFGPRPARVGFQLPSAANDARYRVSGPYRNATVDGDRSPVVLVPGERLHVRALVQNAGGTTGNYTAPLSVNGTVVDRANGSVAPNETVTAPLAHTFTRTGTYDLALGGDNVTVRVRESAPARVVDVTASSRTTMQGGSVTLGAVVRNDADVPAAKTVVFRKDGDVVERRRATVGPGGTGRVNATVPLLAIGATDVRVDGGGSFTVAVRPAPVRTTTGDRTATAHPGNGTNGTGTSENDSVRNDTTGNDTTGDASASATRATATAVASDDPSPTGSRSKLGAVSDAAVFLAVAVALLRARPG